MAPRRVEIDGRDIDLATLAIHSLLIFAHAFLIALPASALAGAGAGSLKIAVSVATLTSGLKVVTYLAKRTGAPIDGNGGSR